MIKGWELLVILCVTACSSPVDAFAPEEFSLPASDTIATPGEAIPISPDQFTKVKSQFGLKNDPVVTQGLGALKPPMRLAQVDEPGCKIQNTAKPDSLVLATGTGYTTGDTLCRIYLAQNGDELFQMKTEADLKARFSPIESREEALSYLFAVRPFLKDYIDGSHTRVSKDGDNYQIATYRTTYYNKCVLVDESIIKVSKSGDVSEVKTNLLQYGSPNKSCLPAQRPQ